MKRMIVLLTLALSSVWAMALPTVDEVQAEVRQGRYEQAETMMKEVVTARPNSAKGHYVYAEILAHNGKREQAIQEAQLARQLDPAITFTEPAKFQAFEKSLQGGVTRSAATASPSAVTSPTVGKAAPVASSGIPAWLWGVGGLAVAMLVWRMISRRTQRPQAYGNPAYAGQPGQPGYGQPGYGQPMGGSTGSGMLGAGLAGVGGFAAGMLAEKYLHGNSSGSQNDAGHGNSHNATQDDGGLIPGYFDNNGGSSGGDIDFGSGGDWGGGSSDSGGGDW